jgi:hypothetical protein
MKFTKTLLALVPAFGLAYSLTAQTPVVTETQKTNAERATTEGAVIAVPDSLPPTLIQFKSVDYDFGNLKQGEHGKTVYTFTNMGPNPAKLENVKPGCGCTVPEWPKEIIPVGESRDIAVDFNTSGKQGAVVKNVSVTYNGEPRVIVLSFKAFIEVPPAPSPDPNAPQGTGSGNGAH